MNNAEIKQRILEISNKFPISEQNVVSTESSVCSDPEFMELLASGEHLNLDRMPL